MELNNSPGVKLQGFTEATQVQVTAGERTIKTLTIVVTFSDGTTQTLRTM